MFKFLRKPYPFSDDLAHNTKVIFFLSLGVLLFMFMYQPYDFSMTDNIETAKLIFGLTVVIFLVMSINLLLLPIFFKKLFQKSSWNIGREIIWNLWLILTLGFGNLLYTQYMGVLDFSFSLVLKMMAFAIVPVSVLITINQDRQLRKNLKTATELNMKLQEKKQKIQTIKFTSDYSKDDLQISPDSILYIQSAGNYIEIIWQEGDEQIKSMIRSSLKKAKEIVQDFRFIYQCHRSYIVNINYIDKIDGNYQGYKLYLRGIDNPVPVSQNYIAELQNLI